MDQEAKAKDDKCHCLRLSKMSGKNPGEINPPFSLTLVCADLRTHQWVSAIFSSNRRKFLKYSKIQNHS